MDFRVRDSGVLISRQALALMHPDKSLGLVLAPEELDEYGVDPVVAAEQPDYDQVTEAAVSSVTLIEGVWTQQWEVVPLPDDQAAANIAARDLLLRAELDLYLNGVRKLREQLLNRLNGIGFRADKLDNQVVVGACIAASQRLLDITTEPAVAAAYAAHDLEALKAAVKREYLAIVAGVPPELVNAFDKVDQ